MPLALNVVRKKSSVFCRKKFCHLGRTSQQKFGRSLSCTLIYGVMFALVDQMFSKNHSIPEYCDIFSSTLVPNVSPVFLYFTHIFAALSIGSQKGFFRSLVQFLIKTSPVIASQLLLLISMKLSQGKGPPSVNCKIGDRKVNINIYFIVGGPSPWTNFVGIQGIRYIQSGQSMTSWTIHTL